MKPFEFLEHTADVGVRAWGKDLPELYQHCAQGLYALALQQRPAAPLEPVKFQVSAQNPKDLLLRFVNELLYYLYVQSLAANQVQIRFLPEHAVEVEGQFVRLTPELFNLEIKSATYHHLLLEFQADRWLAEIYFDV